MEYTSPIGERLRSIRRERDMTQEQVAQHAGLSAVFISRIERGLAMPRTGTIYALAGALGVEPSWLLDKRERLEKPADGPGILGIRDAILTASDLPGMDAGQEHEPAPVRDLERAAEAGWEAYWAGHFGMLASLLPPLIGAARSAERQDGPAACRPLAQAYQLAACLLVHMGDDNLAFGAARSGLRAAARGTDQLQHAIIGGTVGWVLLHQGRLAEAERVAAAMADSVRPGGKAPMAQLTVHGSLLLSAAAPAATAGRPDAVDGYMEQARVNALPFSGGDRHDYATNFGPTQVAMQMCFANAMLKRPGTALAAAKRVSRADLRPISWGAHHLDVAQALLDRGDRKRGDASAAVGALCTALDVSREWALHQGTWRTLVPAAVAAESRVSDKADRLLKAAGLRKA